MGITVSLIWTMSANLSECMVIYMHTASLTVVKQKDLTSGEVYLTAVQVRSLINLAQFSLDFHRATALSNSNMFIVFFL